MIDQANTTPRHPVLRMRFGTELNPPEPGDTSRPTDNVKPEPAANSDAKPRKGEPDK